ncbi:MAG: tyrosine-type recombinase/integrase [Bacteroidia bacterium]
MHTLCYNYVTHLLKIVTDLLSIKQLLGHKSLCTTMIYTHVSKNT